MTLHFLLVFLYLDYILIIRMLLERIGVVALNQKVIILLPIGWLFLQLALLLVLIDKLILIHESRWLLLLRLSHIKFDLVDFGQDILCSLIDSQCLLWLYIYWRLNWLLLSPLLDKVLELFQIFGRRLWLCWRQSELLLLLS
jgi:hypothetical protein